jgi:glycosyltransferase involved in cell wall biosynthesis
LLIVGFENETHRRNILSDLSAAERKVVLNGRLLRVQQRGIEMFYEAADAFVVNSQGRGESFSRAAIEAMAFGLPVLGTDAGGTKEIVLNGETGLLHPVGESGIDVLAANILRLVKDRGYAKQLGAAGQARANDYFSSQRFFRELEHALAPVLGGS